MYLAIIVILVIGQMYLEYVVVKALHLEAFNKKFILGNLAFSIVMSIGFGMLFPAAGMTIAAAGLISTILSQPMYRLTEWYIVHTKPKLLNIQEGYRQNQATVHETLEDLWKLIKMAAWFIRLPFRIIHLFVVGVENLKQKEQVTAP